MLKFLVSSDRDVVVDGLGVFKAGEEREFDQVAAQGFTSLKGVLLGQPNVPEGVTVIVKVVEDPQGVDKEGE